MTPPAPARRRRRRHALGGIGVALALLVPSLAGGPAAAESLGGDALTVTGACDGGDVSIVPDASLSGTVSVDGPIGTETHGPGRIAITTGCGDDPLRIGVPPGMPVSMTLTGDRMLRLGDLVGRIDVSLIGSGLRAGHLSGALNLSHIGGGDVSIASLTGQAAIVTHGSGDVAIGPVHLGPLSLAMTGSGDVAIGPGVIAQLSAAVSGSGDLAVASTVVAGEVTTAGAGDVTIARVLANLLEHESGSGSIQVQARGGAGADDAAPPPAVAIDTPSVHFRADTTGDIVSLLLMLGKLALFAVLAGAALIAGARFVRARRHARAGDAMATRRPEIARLEEALEAVGRRVAALEHVVTSDEFDLARQFREIGASGPR